MSTPARDKQRLTFGKYKGITYAKAYTIKYYVKWVLSVKDATGRMRNLQEYFACLEGIVLPPVDNVGKMMDLQQYFAGMQTSEGDAPPIGAFKRFLVA